MFDKEFIFTKSRRNTQQHHILSALGESCAVKPLGHFYNNVKTVEHFYQNTFFNEHRRRITANIVLQDLQLWVRPWRQIRGYPSGGATTHTNSKTARKNKLLFWYRNTQFEAQFGKKRRNIYPTLIKAEYNNRLWYYTFYLEWLQAHLFAKRMAYAGTKIACFNPAILATNQVNGFEREGKAAKVGKAKKLTKVYTLGVPLLFSNYIYPVFTPADFPRIVLKDDVNKQLGKKIKRKRYV